MITFSWNVISGVMVGFELVDNSEMEIEEKGGFLVVDLFIVRFMVGYIKIE